MSAAQVSRPCPVCAGTEIAPYLQKGELRVVRCRRCSMLYASPVPAEFATGKYYDQIGDAYYLSPAKLESDYAEVRYEREMTLFRRNCTRGSVLDVGCSTGAFLYQLGKRFQGDYTLLGTDASGPALDHAVARGVSVARGSFQEQDFGGCQFDAITFWAVLEHLSEPHVFLEKAASLLRPGGLCFVLVPNMQSLAARLLGARYRYVYLQHLNYFTAGTLTRLVKNWFSVAELRTTHFNPIVIWQDWRRSGQEISNTERAELLKRTTAYKQKAWLKPIRTLYRLSERTLAALNLADNLVLVLQKPISAGIPPTGAAD